MKGIASAIQGYIADNGGLYSPDKDLSDLLASFVNEVGSKIAAGQRDGRQMTLAVSMVNSMVSNAVAASGDDGDHIVIHKGLVVLLPNLFRALLSHPDIYPNQGDVGSCEPFFSPKSAADIGDDASGWLVPKLADARRDHLANLLSTHALLYIFLHEFAHIYHGHTDWLGAHGRLALISEIDVPAIERFSGIARQTLEWDADSSAISFLIECILHPEIAEKNGISHWSGVPEDNYFGNMDDGLAAAFIACTVIHMLYDAAEPILQEDITQATHPLPAVRQQQTITMILYTLSFRMGVNINDAYDRMEGAILSLHRAWTKVFDDDFAWARLLSDPDIQSITDKLNHRYTEQWSLMWEALNGFKRGGKLAPPMPLPNPSFPQNDYLYKQP